MTAKEINEKAREQRAAGNTKELWELADKYHIDKYDMEDFIAGDFDALTNDTSLAMMKIDAEIKEFDAFEIIEDWVQYIKSQIADDTENVFSKAVAGEGKTLKECIAEIIKWSLKNAKEVDKDILKKCGISYKVTLGIPGMKTAKKIISEYYLGKDGGQ